MLLTADHGNADVMMFEDGSPCTAHTTNLVPFSVIGDNYKGCPLKADMALCDIAPTMLEILGIEQPAEMTGKTILEHN
jgi:2,3-bisphosphoglycerate-independent phosphoglycerate mutase